MRDSEVLKAVQPGITSDVDKYYLELAHSIVGSDWLSLGKSATPSIEELETEYELTKSDYEYEKNAENEVAMLKAQIKLRNAQIELLKERRAKMEPSKEMKSPTLGIKTTSGGLKTRRRKHRNGSSSISRYRSTRMSKRQAKTRN
jgi:hypothetical protein